MSNKQKNTNMSKIAIIFGIISFVILAYIAFVVVFAVSKSTYLKTDDGKETNYFKKLGTIHYRQADNVFSLIYNPVSGANAKTFKPIDYSFGKDKKHIFYRDTKQPHVDYATFEITAEGVIRDKNHVYEIERYNLAAIEGADPKTFEIIFHGIGKDDKYVYYGTKRQPHVDCKTFEVIIEKYKTTSGESERLQTVRDKNHEYETDWKQQMLVPVKTSL
ncbi:hypothetical protein AGMMS50230_15540 [Spirochaetia bacterium]|nr:hypothetical protein AGMMS50230_15540 [Spirochaetia bacterium]